MLLCVGLRSNNMLLGRTWQAVNCPGWFAFYMRYLSVYFVQPQSFKCSTDAAKRNLIVQQTVRLVASVPLKQLIITLRAKLRRSVLWSPLSRSVNNIRQIFFAERIVNVWNGLPPSVSFASLSTFRRTIQNADFSQFMKCTWLFNFTIFFKLLLLFLFQVNFLTKLFKVIFSLG